MFVHVFNEQKSSWPLVKKVNYVLCVKLPSSLQTLIADVHQQNEILWNKKLSV